MTVTKNMEIESNQQQQLLDAISERPSFAKNKINYTIFYASSISTICMFIIILVLLSYSVSIGHEIHTLTTKANEILNSVAAMLPIVERLCVHSNFTKSYGDICQM